MIPEFKGTMKSLSQLILGWSAIEKLTPSSIECLTALEILDLKECRDLKCLPSNIDSLRSLKFLDLYKCSRLAILPENLWKMKCLERLDLRYCQKLRSVSELPSTMRYINMESCCSLEPSPALHRQSSLSRPCSSPFFRGYDESSGGVAFTILNRYLQVISSFSLSLTLYLHLLNGISCFFLGVQGLFCQKTVYETATKRKEDGSKTEFQIIVPGCSVPRWLTHQSWGNSISVVLSSNWCNSRWMGFTLCALFNEDVLPDFRARVKAIGDMPHNQYVSPFHFGRCSKRHVWLLYLSCDDWFRTVGNGECSQIEVVYEYAPSSLYHNFKNPVWQCGVSLVYEQDMELMEELNQVNA